MKNNITTLLFTASLLSITTSTHALLVSRLGGLAVYDTTTNLSWLSNASAGAGTTFDNGVSSTDGYMTWSSATAWADSLTVGGFEDWRLPSVNDNTCFGYTCSSTTEIGNLFYNELSGIIGLAVTSTGDPDLNLFSNIETSSDHTGPGHIDPNEHYYWTSSGYNSSTPTHRMIFAMSIGLQGAHSSVNGYEYSAWAVRLGDVGGPPTTVVPVPAAIWLFGFGLLGLVGAARRKS